MDKTVPFPLDWGEWRVVWNQWRNEHDEDLKPSSFRFPGKNIMADAVLGVWSIAGRNVELSEVTFLGDRGVGITFGTGAGTDVPDNGIVHCFADLEHELDML